jgi:NifU-like protein
VSFYPPKIDERFRSPAHLGEPQSSNAQGVSASFSCGSAVRFFLTIDTETGQITSAKFTTTGCGYMTAAADFLSEDITGRKLIELRGLHDTVIKKWIGNGLGEFPAVKKDCMNVAVAALHGALADFRAHRIEEWTGEKALICTCFGISEETIEIAINASGLQTVDEVTDACSAGGGCGSCQPLIQDILDAVHREML